MSTAKIATTSKQQNSELPTNHHLVKNADTGYFELDNELSTDILNDESNERAKQVARAKLAIWRKNNRVWLQLADHAYCEVSRRNNQEALYRSINAIHGDGQLFTIAIVTFDSANDKWIKHQRYYNVYVTDNGECYPYTNSATYYVQHMRSGNLDRAEKSVSIVEQALNIVARTGKYSKNKYFTLNQDSPFRNNPETQETRPLKNTSMPKFNQ